MEGVIRVKAMQSDVEYQLGEEEVLTLSFHGPVDKSVVGKLWSKLESIAKKKVASICVQAGKIDSFDTAGAVFLSELKYLFDVESVSYNNASASLQETLTQLEKTCKAEADSQHEESKRRGFTTNIGAYTMGVLNQFHQNLLFTGEVTHHLLHAVFKPKLVRWKDVWQAMEESGPNALPIIALLGFIIGLILSFQASVQLQKFGAEIFVVNIVGVGMTREMAPLFTAILLAGRTASAFAAEIGTMKINQEIDALSTLGLSSVQFLVLPRIIAVTLMLPLLSLFMMFFSFLGCGIFMVSHGYPWAIFLKQLFDSVHLSYVWGGLIKALIFGLLIASIGCLHGLKTSSGSSAVGRSTTQAVVSAIVTLVVVDGILAVLFFSLGV